jgi:hypothetical protein
MLPVRLKTMYSDGNKRMMTMLTLTPEEKNDNLKGGWVSNFL